MEVGGKPGEGEPTRLNAAKRSSEGWLTNGH